MKHIYFIAILFSFVFIGCGKQPSAVDPQYLEQHTYGDSGQKNSYLRRDKK